MKSKSSVRVANKKLKTPTVPAQDSELGLLLARFSEYQLIEQGNADNTLLAYDRDLKRYTQHLIEQGVEKITAVRPEHIRKHIQELSELGLAPTSVNRAVSAIRDFTGSQFLNGIPRKILPRISIYRNDVDRFLTCLQLRRWKQSFSSRTLLRSMVCAIEQSSKHCMQPVCALPNFVSCDDNNCCSNTTSFG